MLRAVPEADAVEGRVVTAARTHGLAVEVLPCAADLADTAAFCAHYGVAPEDAANAILVAGKGEPRRHAVCLLLATHRLDVNRTVCALLGARKASFADADETVAKTGMMIGGVTVLGLPRELPIWVDAAVLERERIVIGGGSRTMKLRLCPRELEKIPGLRVVPGLAQPRAPG
jgi:prolyl-tRNA editing enzyme YbaK/EbsC (Cys-tRNA(Pro) deacylase)